MTPLPEQRINLSSWGIEQLLEAISETLATAESFRGTNIHPKRIRVQLESHPASARILESWLELDGNRRSQALRKLCDQAAEAYNKPVPRCVRCGQCCRRSSPSLHVQDLPLLAERRLAPADLVVYRRGELLVPFGESKPRPLDQERIKLRHLEDGTCIYFDQENELCTRYRDRPWECRAQSCWDPALAQQLQQQPPLTRQVLFADSEQLLELLKEHDRRCSPSEFTGIFSQLRSTVADEDLARRAVELVAYEEHFRFFVAERLGIPENLLPLVFGRSFTEQLAGYGFEIAREGETRILQPLRETAAVSD